MLRLLVLLCSVALATGEMEGNIVGGAYTSIYRYPHSAFLSIDCVTREKVTEDWICGASVVNQMILLTAGHCVYPCYLGTRIIVHVGNEYRNKGDMRSSHSFVLHEMYDPKTSAHDIALVKLYRPLELQSRISRVAIMKNPPHNEIGMVAGWGLTDEVKKKQGYRLKHIEQKIWSRKKCIKRFGVIPVGTICASSEIKQEFAAQGDSGSALVVRGYIQVGLVSYKVPSVAANIIIYTDVGYYYDWIKINAKRLFCFDNTYE